MESGFFRPRRRFRLVLARGSGVRSNPGPLVVSMLLSHRGIPGVTLFWPLALRRHPAVPGNRCCRACDRHCISLSTARSSARRTLSSAFTGPATTSPVRWARVALIRSVVSTSPRAVWVRCLVTAIKVTAVASGTLSVRNASTSHRCLPGGVDGRPNRGGTNPPAGTSAVPAHRGCLKF